jgi:hypothetical protein
MKFIIILNWFNNIYVIKFKTKLWKEFQSQLEGLGISNFRLRKRNLEASLTIKKENKKLFQLFCLLSAIFFKCLRSQ